MKILLIALATGAAFLPLPAAAQTVPAISQTVSGTRLELSVTGEATRIPDLAVITAGVVTRGATAAAAMQENAGRMERMIAALRRAGIADRDIQTSSISLNPEYRYQDNQPPQLIAYSASNQLNIRFRDIRGSGRILDALVAEGANQVNGPTLTLDNPRAALDEARSNAVAAGRARASLYASALGMQVVRIVSISESGGQYSPPSPMVERDAMIGAAKTEILPGEQKQQVGLAMVFELR